MLCSVYSGGLTGSNLAMLGHTKCLRLFFIFEMGVNIVMTCHKIHFSHLLIIVGIHNDKKTRIQE